MVRRSGICSPPSARAIARLITGGSENHMQQRPWGETAVYVDNDVDVDDVDDDVEGAAAYFFLGQRQRWPYQL